MAAQRLWLELEHREEDILLRVHGRLDELTAPLVARALFEIHRDRRIVVDLENVGFIVATGIDVLLAAERQVEIRGVAESLHRRDRLGSSPPRERTSRPGDAPMNEGPPVGPADAR